MVDDELQTASWCHGAARGGDEKVARADEMDGASLRLDLDSAPQQEVLDERSTAAARTRYQGTRWNKERLIEKP
jgi:hypothetical protein